MAENESAFSKKLYATLPSSGTGAGKHRNQQRQHLSPCGGGLVAVHVGAGSHSRAKEQLYASAMQRACQTGCSSMQGGNTVLHATCRAIKELEVNGGGWPLLLFHADSYAAGAELTRSVQITRCCLPPPYILKFACGACFGRTTPAPTRGQAPT